MKKNVIISITGLQFEAEEEDAIEVVSRGEYGFRNGKHFLHYEELMEEEAAVNRCVMKASEQSVELTKYGVSNVHMLFEKGKSNMTYYNTPYGEILLTINTKDIKIVQGENHLSMFISYDLDMNYQHVSECELRVEVESA